MLNLRNSIHIAALCSFAILGGICSSASASLSMKQEGDVYIIESSAPPTWKLKIDANQGWVARYLYIPATSSVSIVEGDKVGQCCAALGLGNLEWRYIKPGTTTSGVRKPISSTGKGTSKIVENTPSRIIITTSGTNWNCTSGHKQKITILPNRIIVDVEVDYTCTPGTKSMWWLVCLFKDAEIDGGNVTVRDKDSGPSRIKYCEGSCGLPSGTSLPYQVSFPVKSRPIDELVLEIADFGGGGGTQRYELWDKSWHQPGNKYITFYPRLWTKFSSKKKYTFKWGWRFDGTSTSSFTRITDVEAVGNKMHGNKRALSAANKDYSFINNAGRIRFNSHTEAIKSISLLSASGRMIAKADIGSVRSLWLPANAAGVALLAVAYNNSGNKTIIHRIAAGRK